jgi:hypothetical protein
VAAFFAVPQISGDTGTTTSTSPRLAIAAVEQNSNAPLASISKP